MIKSPKNCNAIWKQFVGASNPGTKYYYNEDPKVLLVPKFTDKTSRHKKDQHDIELHPGHPSDKSSNQTL